jgi:hypothetical protein
MSSSSMALPKQAVVSIVPIGVVSGLGRIISTIGSSMPRSWPRSFMVRDRRSDAEGLGKVQGGKEGLTHECERQGIRKGDEEKKK